jgi:peptidoglycan/LPS O-acetylase OafA/YrhL
MAPTNPEPSGQPSRAPSALLELDRIVELDGVRGFALCMVLWMHCFLLNPTNVVFRLMNSVGGSMFTAIDLFFVLSGFLITGILIRTREGEHRARNFYVRRVLRIFPAYYCVVLFTFFVYPLFYAPLRGEHLEREAPYFLVYMQNWWYAFHGSVGSWPGVHHLWSMAIEEQFYLVWPLVVWYTRPERLGRLCVAIFAASIALKLILLASGASLDQLFVATYCRLEGLAAGAGIAVLWQTHRTPRPPPWLHVAGGIALLAFLFLIFRKSGSKAGNPRDMVAHTIAATIVFTWMIYAVVTADPATLIRRFFRNPVLRFLGRYSYGIYLIHWVVYWQIKYFILDAFGERQNTSNAVATLAGIVIIAVTIVLALAMYRFLEEPALRLKRYFTSSGTSAKSRAEPAALET